MSSCNCAIMRRCRGGTVKWGNVSSLRNHHGLLRSKRVRLCCSISNEISKIRPNLLYASEQPRNSKLCFRYLVLFHSLPLLGLFCTWSVSQSLHITSQIAPPPLPLPLYHSFHINDILQLPTHFHNSAPNHPRIYGHCFPDQLLYGRRSVKA